MKKIGIIAEFNPFHNGHKYLIDNVKKMYPESIIIAVISGNFTQRADSSIMNKWDKTKVALLNGIDLVAELPYEYTVNGADDFAFASVKILNELKIDTLVFGSESDDVEVLKNIAKEQLDENYKEKVKIQLKKGINYPTALNNALSKKIDSPNDILALSYIREIIKNNYNIDFISIKRTNSYHDKELNNKITSATSIRENIHNKDINKYMPSNSYKLLKENISLTEMYFPYLKYKIISEIDNLDKYHEVCEGIENKIKKEIFNSNSLDELIHNINSKRYTYSKIKRMLLNILVSFTKEENENKIINYIRILGFNKNGQKHLNSIKKEVNIPIYTKFNKEMENELKYTSIYASVFNKDYFDYLIKKEITELIRFN